jgi:hypothetical protein
MLSERDLIYERTVLKAVRGMIENNAGECDSGMLQGGGIHSLLVASALL